MTESPAGIFPRVHVRACPHLLRAAYKKKTPAVCRGFPEIIVMKTMEKILGLFSHFIFRILFHFPILFLTDIFRRLFPSFFCSRCTRPNGSPLSTCLPAGRGCHSKSSLLRIRFATFFQARSYRYHSDTSISIPFLSSSKKPFSITASPRMQHPSCSRRCRLSMTAVLVLV